MDKLAEDLSTLFMDLEEGWDDDMSMFLSELFIELEDEFDEEESDYNDDELDEWYNNILDEKFKNRGSLRIHFRDHCLTKNNIKSTPGRIRFDFTEQSEYSKYERSCSDRIKNPEVNIKKAKKDIVADTISKFDKGSIKSFLLDLSCGIYNEFGENVAVGVINDNSVYTKNYKNPTATIVIYDTNGNTRTVYAVDKNNVEKRINKQIERIRRNEN